MKKKLLIITSFLFLLIIYLIIGKKYNLYIPCVFHEITNLYCPGCGITRMLFSIIKGEFYQAFRYNPLLFIMLPFFIFLLIDYLYNSQKNKKSLYQKIPNTVWIILLIIVIIYGIIRNIYPFTYLKPTLI